MRFGLVVAAVLALLASVATACAPGGPSNSAPAQPYAGLQTREIKALAPERIVELRAGGGAGFALAAELNHYPGPKHVLELARRLELRPDQEAYIRALVAPMETEARMLGERLIALEAELDA